MKTTLTSLGLMATIFLLSQGVYSQSQTVLDGYYIKSEKTISIKDIRNSHVDTSGVDTTTVGRHSGDVYVVRTLSEDPFQEMDKRYDEIEKHDTIPCYIIHIIRPYKNELMNYNLPIASHDDFDKVRYTWLTERVVSLTFVNSSTKKTRSIELTQPLDEEGCCLVEYHQDLQKVWHDGK